MGHYTGSSRVGPWSLPCQRGSSPTKAVRFGAARPRFRSFPAGCTRGGSTYLFCCIYRWSCRIRLRVCRSIELVSPRLCLRLLLPPVFRYLGSRKPKIPCPWRVAFRGLSLGNTTWAGPQSGYGHHCTLSDCTSNLATKALDEELRRFVQGPDDYVTIAELSLDGILRRRERVHTWTSLYAM